MKIDDLIKGFEEAQEHTQGCGYIAISLELRDLIIKTLKELKVGD